MNFPKRMLSLFFAVLLCGTAFVSCKKEESNVKKETTVMSVSLNPEVEFILDENGVVLSANALNEEGNLILSARVFTGISEKAAVKLFIDVANETGFLEVGTEGKNTNHLKVSFSGEEAQKRFDAMKEELNRHLSDIGLAGSVEKGADITAKDLETKLSECCPWLEDAKIAGLTYEEKVKALLEERKETAEIYSQQLKKAYYEQKELAVREKALQYVKDKLDAASALALDVAMKAYNEQAKNLTDLRENLLLSKDSPYQKALAAFLDKKAEFLNYRKYLDTLPEGEVSEEQKARLAAIQSMLESTEQSLNTAYTTANSSIDNAKALLDSAYGSAVSVITGLNTAAKSYLDEANGKINEFLEKFETEQQQSFKEKGEAAANDWKEREAALKAGYQG